MDTHLVANVKPMSNKYPTQAVPFVFGYVDLVGAPEQIMRLMRSRAASDKKLPDSYFQAVCLDGPEIKAAVTTRIEKTAKAYRRSVDSVLGKLNHDNFGRPVVGMLCGNMLDADNGRFVVGMFSIFGVHGGTRYRVCQGLAEAQEVLTNWVNRTYRIGNGFVKYK